jgi:hypothetical protein
MSKTNRKSIKTNKCMISQAIRKKYVFNCFLKVEIDFKRLISFGRRFHNIGAANSKALFPSEVRDFSDGRPTASIISSLERNKEI